MATSTLETQMVHIHRDNPLCRELQGGHSSYHLGLIIAEPGSHRLAANGDCLVDAPGLARDSDEPTANCHLLAGRHDGKAIYGIRFWQTQEPLPYQVPGWKRS